MSIQRPVTATLTALVIVGGSLMSASVSQAATATSTSTTTTASSTQYPVNGPILDKWNQLGGAYGVIGSPTSPQIYANGGYFQNFSYGSIYLHPSVYAPVAVITNVEFEYKNKGAINSALGFPLADEVKSPSAGITVQQFQNGVITFDSKIPQSSTNLPLAVIGELGAKFNASGGADALGPASSAEVLITGGRTQSFRNGATIVHSSSTGARLMSNTVITNKWKSLGSQTGVLGFPTSDVLKSSGGVTYQNFQGGIVLIGENGTTAYALTGSVLNTFKVAGGVNVVGTARTELTASGSGSLQTFQNGVITVSPAGSYFVKSGPILSEWQKIAQQNGPLGYPTSNLLNASGAVFQKFERGVITTSSFGTYPVYGPIANKYAQLGGTASLGAAKGYSQNRFNGAVQSFAGGTIASSATTGDHLISHPTIINLWNGGTGDSLRMPVAPSYVTADGGTAQKFENGVVVVQYNGAVNIIWGSGAQGPAPR